MILKNAFKQNLRDRKVQIGLWQGIGNALTAEISAGAGYDWLLLDAEHGPNDIPLLLSQLQAVAPYHAEPIVRPGFNDPVLIKYVLDIGAQTLLVPMVNTRAEAEEAVRATRYPPQGYRGVAAALVRASRWNRIPNYLTRANDEICLLVQAETRKAMDNLAEIAAVEGVDGVFIGPADLSADMGFIDNPTAPEVQQAIEQGIATIVRAGKAPGILMANEELAKHYIDLGALFVAVGVDVSLLARGAERLAQAFGRGTDTAGGKPSVY